MIKIDEIFELLDSNNSEEVQQRGIDLAKNLKCITVLISPKNVKTWNNCAKILAEKSDDELEIVISDLLLWIKSDKCPILIFERIKSIKKEYLIDWCDIYIDNALNTQNELWINRLYEIREGFSNIDTNAIHEGDIDIDYIMSLLSWDNSEEKQALGIRLGKNIKTLSVFILPVININGIIHGKDLWDCCSKIISERKDKELEPYLYKIFEWLQDLNWPGAQRILERLNRFEKNAYFIEEYEKCKNEAIKMEDDFWLECLSNIKLEK